MARIIDGVQVAHAISSNTAARLALAPPGFRPCLAVLVVGEPDPSTRAYLASQRRAAERTGLEFKKHTLDGACSETEVLKALAELNRDGSVHGLLIPRPLPDRFCAARVFEALDPAKDVEGMHPLNLGGLVHGRAALPPCTADAAVRLFRSTGIPPRGLEVVVVGHSETVGKPIALLLVQELATVTICHIGTRDLAFHTGRADVLFTAAGVPGLIRPEMVKPGAVVIDIGINVQVTWEEGEKRTRIVGDADFEGLQPIAGFITPVPGGVGPVTTAVLMENTAVAALRTIGIDPAP